MKQVILLLGLCLSFFLDVNAQRIPGYQGKTIQLHYEVVPRIMYINEYPYLPYDSKGEFTEKFHEVKHTVGLHWVMGKNSSIGVDVTGILKPRYFRDEDKLYEINGSQFGLSYKRFFEGNIAPLGGYLEFRPFLLRTTTREVGIYWGGNQEIYIPFGTIQEISEGGSLSSLGISLFFGKQWVLFDRIVPSYSFGITYFPDNRAGIHAESAASYIAGSGINSNYNYIIDMNIGLGVLLF